MADAKVSDEARYDLLIGLSFVIFGCLVLFWLIPKGIKVPDQINNIALSPALWPTFVSGFMIITGLLTLAGPLKTFFGRRTNEMPGAQGALSIKHGLNWRGLLSIVLLLPYYLMIKDFGLVLPSMLAILCYMVLAGERNLITILVMPLVFTALLTLFFIYIASIMIPLGPIELIM